MIFELLFWSATGQEDPGRWYQKGEVTRPASSRRRVLCLCVCLHPDECPCLPRLNFPRHRMKALAPAPWSSRIVKMQIGGSVPCAPSPRIRLLLKTRLTRLDTEERNHSTQKASEAALANDSTGQGRFLRHTYVGGTSGCFTAVAISVRRLPWNGLDLMRAWPAPHLSPSVGNELGSRIDLTFALCRGRDPR